MGELVWWVSASKHAVVYSKLHALYIEQLYNWHTAQSCDWLIDVILADVDVNELDQYKIRERDKNHNFS